MGPRRHCRPGGGRPRGGGRLYRAPARPGTAGPPGGIARPPAGPLTGRWDTAPGSVAGFRSRKPRSAWATRSWAGRGAVRGSLVVSGDRLVSGTIRVDLRAITVNGKRQAQFAASLGTREYPAATFTLGRPVPLGPAFAAGRRVTADITGRLTLHGVSRLVAVTLSARRSGSVIQAAGRVPVVFAAWRIKGSAGFGFLGSLADHGVAEFLLVLHRRPGPPSRRPYPRAG